MKEVESLKKLSIALIVFIITLSGCSSQFKESMEKGNKAVSAQDYVSAISHFKNASRLKPQSQEAKSELTQAKVKQFDQLYKMGLRALENSKYDEAVTNLEEAYKIFPTREETLLENLDKAKNLKIKQKQLDEYIEWNSEAYKKNQLILKTWRNASDSFSIGHISLEEFVIKMEETINKTNEVLMEAEEQLLKINGELNDIHSKYVNKLDNNHKTVRNVIMVTKKEEVTAQDILQVGGELSNIQEQQGEHIKNLRNYAKVNELEIK